MKDTVFNFRAITDPSVVARLDISSLDLPDPPNDVIVNTYGGFGAYWAYIRGSLMNLFGNPLFSTNSIDEAFTYVVEASNEHNQTWNLAVYQTSSGIEIGGDFDDFSNRDAAKRLQELILSTAPADYEQTIYSTISGNNVTYGCHSGRCYWRE